MAAYYVISVCKICFKHCNHIEVDVSTFKTSKGAVQALYERLHVHKVYEPVTFMEKNQKCHYVVMFQYYYFLLLLYYIVSCSKSLEIKYVCTNYKSYFSLVCVRIIMRRLPCCKGALYYAKLYQRQRE